jgi:Rps23 Pro-64 3,4-dihydroxylase Tpa1-like proline 4-hydroxylase
MLPKIEDYIVVIENAITPALCEAILGEYVNSSDWVTTTVGEGHIKTSIRNCSAIGISFSNIINKNPKLRGELDKYLHTSVSEIIKKYRKKFPECSIEEDSGYDLLRYKEGEFYTEHTDSFKARPRAVSCSIALNDDYEGGEWAFFNREKVIKVPKGAAVLFPSNFMYPHEIMPVTKGTRYSIVTWFI